MPVVERGIAFGDLTTVGHGQETLSATCDESWPSVTPQPVCTSAGDFLLNRELEKSKIILVMGGRLMAGR